MIGLGQGKPLALGLLLVCLAGEILGAAPAGAEPGAVRLLVSLTTGDEWGLVLPLAPAAQLVQWQGRMFVLVGLYPTAAEARRAGLRVQDRLRLPFVIDAPPVEPPPSRRAEALGGPLRLEDLRSRPALGGPSLP